MRFANYDIECGIITRRKTPWRMVPSKRPIKPIYIKQFLALIDKAKGKIS